MRDFSSAMTLPLRTLCSMSVLLVSLLSSDFNFPHDKRLTDAAISIQAYSFLHMVVVMIHTIHIASAAPLDTITMQNEHRNYV